MVIQHNLLLSTCTFYILKLIDPSLKTARIARGCSYFWRMFQLLKNAQKFSRLLKNSRDCSKILEIAQNCSKLLRIFHSTHIIKNNFYYISHITIILITNQSVINLEKVLLQHKYIINLNFMGWRLFRKWNFRNFSIGCSDS